MIGIRIPRDNLRTDYLKKKVSSLQVITHLMPTFTVKRSSTFSRKYTLRILKNVRVLFIKRLLQMHIYMVEIVSEE